MKQSAPYQDGPVRDEGFGRLWAPPSTGQPSKGCRAVAAICRWFPIPHSR